MVVGVSAASVNDFQALGPLILGVRGSFAARSAPAAP